MRNVALILHAKKGGVGERRAGPPCTGDVTAHKQSNSNRSLADDVDDERWWYTHQRLLVSIRH